MGKTTQAFPALSPAGTVTGVQMIGGVRLVVPCRTYPEAANGQQISTCPGETKATVSWGAFAGVITV